MKPTISIYDRWTRVVGGLLSLFVAFVLFENLIAIIIAFVLGVWILGEAVVGRCVIFERLGIKKPSDRLSADALLFLGMMMAQVTLGYIWIKSGYGKITGGTFANGFAGSIQAFLADNPYDWYRPMLEWTLAQADWFGSFVMWGEFLTGVGLIASTVIFLFFRSQTWRQIGIWIAVLSAIGSIKMSANFYLAAGHLSASTASVNTVMFWVGFALLYVWVGWLFHKPKWPRS